jgi:hypothetical protein
LEPIIGEPDGEVMVICGFIDTKTEETPVKYAVTPHIHIFSEKNDEIYVI